MIEGIVPAGVAVAESWGDDPAALLFEEERELVRDAVEKRRQEFATARHCARRALATLGREQVAIPAGARGEPIWPAGIVGSITHCEGYRACAAARSGEVASIGIDAEPNHPLPDGIVAAVASEHERAHVRLLSGDRPDVCWDRLLFSAKEAIYKAWYPLAGRWLGFEDAVVTIDAARFRFASRLLVSARLSRGSGEPRFGGSWSLQGGVLATAVVVMSD